MEHTGTSTPVPSEIGDDEVLSVSDI
jgi:hypothetical protein